MTTSKTLRNQRGFTLIEIAIVLTIVGLIVGGIWIAAATVSSNQKKSELAKDTLSIIQGARNLYAQSPPAASATSATIVATLVTASAVPANLVASASTLRNAFGGTTTVATDATQNFVVTHNTIPQDGCIELLSGRIASSTQAANQIGLVSAVVNAGTAAQSFTPTTAAAACNVTAAAGNSIVLTFRSN